MEQTYLGRSGLVVSELCLGTMTFGDACDLEASAAIVDRFREAGGTFLDTADVYVRGRSEELVGAIVKPYRDEVVVATKAFGGTGPGPNERSASRRHLVKAVEDSLRRLDTDYIDLYQIHAFDVTTPLEETLSALDDLVRAGKVRYLGVSNFVGWQIERACRLQEARGYDALVALQPQYSLIERQVEFETLPAARANSMGVLAWSPLAAGFLTGKYERGQSAEGKGRFGQFVDGITDQAWAVLDAVREVAQAHDTTPAAVALAWLRARWPGHARDGRVPQHGVVPIVGATRLDQLVATLPATDLELADEEVARLTQISEPARGYPWDWGSGEGRPPRVLRSP